MDSQCYAQRVASTNTIFDGTEKHIYYKHWSAIQGNTASDTSTLRVFTENNYNPEAGREKVFHSIRPLKFTLQPALSEKYFSNPHGLLITMEVPVYSGETIHDAYKAIPLPQPIKNTTTAATLKLERNYLIVSRRDESYAEMKSEEYLSCLGIELLILCTKPVALVSAQDQLCLTSLLYNHELAALKTCTREVTELPILPTAIYLGKSMYLLNAADDQQFLYNITYSGGGQFSNRVPACKS